MRAWLDLHWATAHAASLGRGWPTKLIQFQAWADQQ